MQKRRIVADDAAAEPDLSYLLTFFLSPVAYCLTPVLRITFWTFGHGSEMSFPSIHLCKPDPKLPSPKDHIPEVLVPDQGVNYQETHLENYVILRQEIVEFLNTVIRR